MGQIHERCILMEQHKYWNEFEPNNHQFFKILIYDFEHQLRLPKKFVRNFKGNLSDTISLKGPSGQMWTVKLVRTADQVVFQDGWDKFVRDHSLEISDFLVFRYNGNSSFSVLIFDKSGCELEGSYFVKKHGSSCSDKGCVLEMNQEEVPIEVIDVDDSHDATVETNEMQKGNANKGGQNVCSKPSTSGLKHQKPEKDKETQGMKAMQDGKDKKGKESSYSKVAATMSKNKQPVVQGGASRKGRKKWCTKPIGTKGKGVCGVKPIGSRLVDESSEGESVHVVDISRSQQRTRPNNPRLSDSNNTKRKRKFQDTDQDDVVEILTEEDTEEDQVDTYKKRGPTTKRSHDLENQPKKKPGSYMTAAPRDLFLKSYLLYHISNRRPVTEEEKQRAYRLASEHSPAGPSVMVIMKSTCVYKYFYNFPKEWGTKYISSEDKKIRLRVPPNEKTWVVQFKNNKWKCGILGRWGKFVEDNNLEENDVCIFQINPKRKANHDPIVLDVSIFRVVDELVPLTRFKNPSAVAKHE